MKTNNKLKIKVLGMQNSIIFKDAQLISPVKIDESLINSALSRLGLFVRNYQTRKQLASLSPEQLNDVGISFEQAQEECRKPFWT